MDFASNTFHLLGSNNVMIAPPRPKYWMLSNEDGMLVRIDMDTGAIEFGPNYTPDEAAKTFWEAVGNFRCRF